MNKVYTTACVIVPPKEFSEPIQEIRKKFDKQFKRWMPHINLIYPFRPIGCFNDLKKFCEICQNIESFTVNLKVFRSFHHNRQNYTLWLDPEPKELIISLQANLIKIVPDCNDLNNFENGYTPHLSVGQVKGKLNLLKTIELLQKQWKEISFPLKKIYFISRENVKDSSFSIVQEIPLKE